MSWTERIKLRFGGSRLWRDFGLVQLQCFFDQTWEIMGDDPSAIPASPGRGQDFHMVPIHAPAQAKDLEPFSARPLNDLHVFRTHREFHSNPPIYAAHTCEE